MHVCDCEESFLMFMLYQKEEKSEENDKNNLSSHSELWWTIFKHNF